MGLDSGVTSCLRIHGGLPGRDNIGIENGRIHRSSVLRKAVWAVVVRAQVVQDPQQWLAQQGQGFGEGLGHVEKPCFTDVGAPNAGPSALWFAVPVCACVRVCACVHVCVCVRPFST